MQQARSHSHVDLISLSGRNNGGMKAIDDDGEEAPDRARHRKELGARVEALRLRCDLSQPALASMADITQPSLWAIENGRTKEITARTLFGLSHALGTTVEHLWSGSQQSVQDAMDEVELVAVFRELSSSGRGAVLQSARTVRAAEAKRLSNDKSRNAAIQAEVSQKDEPNNPDLREHADPVTTRHIQKLERSGKLGQEALERHLIVGKGKNEHRQSGGASKPRTRRGS